MKAAVGADGRSERGTLSSDAADDRGRQPRAQAARNVDTRRRRARAIDARPRPASLLLHLLVGGDRPGRMRNTDDTNAKAAGVKRVGRLHHPRTRRQVSGGRDGDPGPCVAGAHAAYRAR